MGIFVYTLCGGVLVAYFFEYVVKKLCAQCGYNFYGDFYIYDMQWYIYVAYMIYVDFYKELLNEGLSLKFDDTKNFSDEQKRDAVKALNNFISSGYKYYSDKFGWLLNSTIVMVFIMRYSLLSRSKTTR